ncbi:MAG: hypothetical protein C0618_09695 [Desulfuromonas sp.]|nr:MAG: hypothetical protein C0618_09695 [Desulfuromonas sp.]
MFRILICMLLVVVLTGCSTRQVIPELDGSTAQRLVTHSLDRLMKEIPAEDFIDLEEKSVYVRTHFVKESPVVSYATERFKLELAHRFSCQIAPEPNQAEYIVELLFTSLATEHDTFGLHIPFLVLPGSSGAININLLAIEMFHGISEMSYYIKDAQENVLLKRDKSKATVRTDKLALPIITIPINTMD